MGVSAFSGASSVIKPGVVTSSTRPSAPFVGQLIYETDTANLEAYNGSAWVTQNALQLVKTQTIGTTVSSVEVTDAFSATYDNYRIIISGGVSSDASVNLAFKLGATTTGYYWGMNGRTYANADNSIGAANQVNWRAGAGSPKILSMKIDIFSPFLSEETSFSGQYQVPTTAGTAISNGGFLDNTTSYTAFTITPSTGTLTGGTIRVYGYANS